MVENENFEVGSFILETNSSPTFSIVDNRHVARMEFLLLLLLVHFLNTPVLDAWRPGLNLNLTDWSLKLLRFIRADENAKSIKVVYVAIIVGVFWLLTNWLEIIHCETISVKPVFPFELVSCHLEINSRNPCVFLWVWDYICHVATRAGSFGGEYSFIFKKNRVSMCLPFCKIIKNSWKSQVVRVNGLESWIIFWFWSTLVRFWFNRCPRFLSWNQCPSKSSKCAKNKTSVKLHHKLNYFTSNSWTSP